MKKRILCCAVLCTLLASLLSGCAAKSSGENEPGLQTPAEIPAEQTGISAAEYKTFETTDGVTVHLADIDPDTGAWELSAVEVTPHELTAADARRIADALFGDGGTYYEHRDSGVRPMTKAVMEEKLALWEGLLEPGALEAIYGDQPELISQTRETIERFIENARSSYDSAPETEERLISDWSFHPWEYYTAMTDYTPDGRVSLEVDTVCDSVPYTLSVSNRRNDFYLNSLYVYPYIEYVAPDLVEENLFRIDHSYSARPTDAQLESARTRAEELLNAFGLGEWEIDQCVL